MRPRILLLHDAHAAQGRIDSSDTLLEAEAIAAALAGLGYDTTMVPVDLDLRRLQHTLTDLAPRLVVNLVESLEGRGQLIQVVPALLEALRVPYTGCSANALGLTSHKLLAKRHLLRAGLPAPAFFTATDDDGPWIVKSVWEHASLGIDDSSVARGAAAVTAVLAARRAEFGGDWFAERFVPGRELNVALLATDRGPRVLPVTEIRFEHFPAGKPAIVGYAAKWHADSFEYRNTVRGFDIEPELAARAERLALACWDLFALDGYARVDLRVDAGGTPWVLEVNANPCLSPDAGFAAALEQAGIAYATAIAGLVEAALRRAAAMPEKLN
jgi:D-alanine-D-alanine ligase